MIDSRMIAHHRPLSLDMADPHARIGAWNCPAFLVGDGRFGRSGRWSIHAAEPRAIIESRSGNDFRVSWERSTFETGPDALVGLEALIQRYRLAGETNGLDPDLPFQGGLIGLLSYDLAPRIESLPRRLDMRSAIPACRFGLYDTFVLIDHVQERADLWAVDLLGEGEDAVKSRLDRWSDRLANSAPERSSVIALEPVRPDQTPDGYRTMIDQAKRYIEAGDIFQVNLAQRFATNGSVDPLALAGRLQSVSPAPYSAYLSWDRTAILSASPELFYETNGRAILTRPIKGTRPRSNDPVQDQKLRAELLASAKDNAELTMIVDLERNDLGRVCEFGSVQVVDPRSVESYPNVHHTVASVAGRLRADAGPIDIVRAMFPGGSITGAPKIRAMEIIDELEPCRRGVYTGSIGYWSANGRSAFNIAIRTMVLEGDWVSYHVGGGIVADSNPEQEYQETLDKGRGLFTALSRPGADG